MDIPTAEFTAVRKNQKPVSKYPLIRTIYLYVFALVGLVMVIIAGVQFVDLALKVYIFKAAEEQFKSFAPFPPERVIEKESLEGGGETVVEVKPEEVLTSQEKAALERWLVEFRNWEQTQKDYDPVRASRHRTASNALAMLIIGLPVFLYHWGVIQREIRHQKLV